MWVAYICHLQGLTAAQFEVCDDAYLVQYSRCHFSEPAMHMAVVGVDRGAGKGKGGERGKLAGS